ncbi:MAG TPA: hypothetical protein VFS55_08555 [Dokdonella sp.]|nr:hypothetical protein [Dokdonella sp.]
MDDLSCHAHLLRILLDDEAAAAGTGGRGAVPRDDRTLFGVEMRQAVAHRRDMGGLHRVRSHCATEASEACRWRSGHPKLVSR